MGEVPLVLVEDGASHLASTVESRATTLTDTQAKSARGS